VEQRWEIRVRGHIAEVRPFESPVLRFSAAM
jgi:hypothetical protein